MERRHTVTFTRAEWILVHAALIAARKAARMCNHTAEAEEFDELAFRVRSGM